MADMTKTQLEKTVKYYRDNNALETAKNFILSHGQQIKDYPIDEELFKINELIKKENNKNKMEE